MGALVLPAQTTTPLVFLAGGVGITPFRSICRYAADAKTGHAITLFYSSRTPEETPFLEELGRIPEQNKDISVVITMTRAPVDPASWTGLRGRLDGETIKERCPVWEKAVYYVAGPPVMADAMTQTLATTECACRPDQGGTVCRSAVTVLSIPEWPEGTSASTFTGDPHASRRAMRVGVAS